MTTESRITAAPREDNVLRLEDGRMLGYAEYGDPAGTPVFAFHGFPGSRLQFRVAGEAARKRGVRVIAPDRPGMGLSTFQAGRKLLDWPHDVRELADALGIDRFAVVGVSGGGPYVAACAYALRGRVTRAAIISGIGPLRGANSTEGMLIANRVSFGAQRWFPPLARALLWLMSTAASRGGGKAMERFLKALPEADQRVLARPDVREMFADADREAFRGGARGAALENSIYTRAWGFRLREITVPVDVWQGGADRNVPPAHARRQAGAIPDATLHFYPDEGHMLVIDRIDEIIEAVTSSAT
jgi:pimeloyl-ACP methyl ester carboxylesterase